MNSAWHFHGASVLYYCPNLDQTLMKSSKIAAFDLVNTLIWTDRGERSSELGLALFGSTYFLERSTEGRMDGSSLLELY
jgi:hypothetical protein